MQWESEARLAVERALAEDIGTGDLTTDACIPSSLRAEARFVAREAMTVAGVELLRLLFEETEIQKRSGDRVGAGEQIALVRGAARTLLTRERVTLNFLQRLSGSCDTRREICCCRRGNRRTNSGYAQNYARAAGARKNGGGGRRRGESPHGPV